MVLNPIIKSVAFYPEILCGKIQGLPVFYHELNGNRRRHKTKSGIKLMWVWRLKSVAEHQVGLGIHSVKKLKGAPSYKIISGVRMQNIKLQYLK